MRRKERVIRTVLCRPERCVGGEGAFIAGFGVWVRLLLPRGRLFTKPNDGHSPRWPCTRDTTSSFSSLIHGGSRSTKAYLATADACSHPCLNPHHRLPFPPLSALRRHPSPLFPIVGLPPFPLQPSPFCLPAPPSLVHRPIPPPRFPPLPPRLLLALQVPLPAAPAPCPVPSGGSAAAAVGAGGASGMLPKEAEEGADRSESPSLFGFRDS